MKLFDDTMQKKNKAMTVSKPMLRVMALFNPLMKEMVEIMYQYNQDYYFDSTKLKTKSRTLR